MYKAILADKDTWWVGVNDYETDMFESLWPLPQGVAYNAYAVIGSTATAAIDTVKGPYLDEYINKLTNALGGRELNYLVVNHMEPDHAGLIAQMKARWPGLKFIGNAKTVPMLKWHRGEHHSHEGWRYAGLGRACPALHHSTNAPLAGKHGNFRHNYRRSVL